MFPKPYVPRFMILVPMFPMSPSPYDTPEMFPPLRPKTHITQSLCSPVPMFPIFPSPNVPSPYVPQSLCSPVHGFPDLIDVPSPYVPPTNSPVPMFPVPIPQKCFPFPMFPQHDTRCLYVSQCLCFTQSLCSPYSFTRSCVPRPVFSLTFRHSIC